MNRHTDIIHEALLDYLLKTKSLLRDKETNVEMAMYLIERMKRIDAAIESLPIEEDAE